MSPTLLAGKFDCALPIISKPYTKASKPSKINIKNFAGFIKVPVRLASPLRIQDAA
jgi:hypothetical protein